MCFVMAVQAVQDTAQLRPEDICTHIPTYTMFCKEHVKCVGGQRINPKVPLILNGWKRGKNQNIFTKLYRYLLSNILNERRDMFVNEK